jgi:hypothetical protein
MNISYSISNVNLQVECEDNHLAKKVIGAIDNYFLMTRNRWLFLKMSG